MRNPVEAGAYIALEYPLRTIFSAQSNETCFDGICCGARCPKPVGVRISRRLRNRIKSQQVEGLHGSITHRQDTKWALFAIAFRDIDTARRLWVITPLPQRVNGCGFLFGCVP